VWKYTASRRPPKAQTLIKPLTLIDNLTLPMAKSGGTIMRFEAQGKYHNGGKTRASGAFTLPEWALLDVNPHSRGAMRPSSGEFLLNRHSG
jgi:hypothetical protein